jgi:hypothetical protein
MKIFKSIEITNPQFELKVKKEYKYIGFHNTKEVCSETHWNKTNAKASCEEKLLSYFHGLQDNVSKYSLKYYLGEVAYVGYKEIK